MDHCRIDAEISASFKIYPDLKAGNEIWLWNWQDKKIVHEIPVMHAEAVPFDAGVETDWLCMAVAGVSAPT